MLIDENKFRELIAILPISMVAIDPLGGRIIHANPAALELWGYTEDEILTKTASDLTFPGDIPESIIRNKDLSSGTINKSQIIKRYRRKDNSYFLAETIASTAKDDNGKSVLIIGCTKLIAEFKIDSANSRDSDIPCCHEGDNDLFTRLMSRLGIAASKPIVLDEQADQKNFSRAEICATLQNEQLLFILDNLPAMVGYWDKDLINRFSNKAYSSWFGKSPEELLGKHIRFLLGEEIFKLNLPHIKAALLGQPQKFERDLPTPDGSGIRHSFAEYIPDIANNEVRGFFVQVFDITEQKLAEGKLHQLAFYDRLTNLPNSSLLQDRLNQAMAFTTRSGKYGAVLLIDIDRFKFMNNEWGRNVCDLILKEVARRLTICVREIDSVLRLGGDKFLIILDQLDTNKYKSTTGALEVANKINKRLTEPYSFFIDHEALSEKSLDYHCTISIGAALFINHENTVDEMLDRVKTAIDYAKDSGGNSIRFHASE